MSATEQAVSLVAVTFQVVGCLLLALILGGLATTSHKRHAKIWALAWASMFIGLLGVRLFMAFGHRGWWTLYLLGEWCALALLAAGCIELTRPVRVRPVYVGISLLAAIALALTMVRISGEFNLLFSGQAVLLSAGFLSSFLILGRSPAEARGLGWRIMRGATGVLAVQFFSYLFLYRIHESGQRINFLVYAPLIDLLGEIVLTFGMVFHLSEEARRELNVAFQQVRISRDRIEIKAQTDPVTDAWNRHAFYTMVAEVREGGVAPRGCVAMIDIDHFKKINDREGHAAGDLALRAITKAVRQHVRAGDLVFRWGGDEFLIYLPNITKSMAVERLETARADAEIQSQGTSRKINFSIGVAEFGDQRSLEDAVGDADAEMYANKDRNRDA